MMSYLQVWTRNEKCAPFIAPLITPYLMASYLQVWAPREDGALSATTGKVPLYRPYLAPI